MNGNDESTRRDGLGGVIAMTAAAVAIPVVGVAFALRGAVVGLSRLRRRGDRTIGVLLVTLAGVALVAQLGHAQYIEGLMRSRELARQAQCATRLKQIGTALMLYQNENNDDYPRIANPSRKWPTSYTADPRRHRTEEAFYANEHSCNLQPMWLLVAGEIVTPDIFQCPSDKSYKAPPKGDGWGFDSWNNTSYAFQPFTPHEDNRAWPNQSGQGGSVVVAADKQTTAGALKGNLNHKEGASVMQLNTAVAFRKGEANAHGWKDNNIYVKDVSADGDVQTIDEEDLAKRAGQLPDHINDSVLFWKEDGRSSVASVEGHDHHEGHDHAHGGERVYGDANHQPGRVTDAVGATPPAGKSLWPIIWWCVGIGAAIGVTLALWKTARESKAKKQDESQE
jgi:hypothetical protein